MPGDKDVPSGSLVNNLGSVKTTPGVPEIGATNPADFESTADMQLMFDNTMSHVVTKALTSAMGLMSESLSQTITHAILGAQKSTQPVATQALPAVTPSQPHIGRKATAKTKHSSISQMDSYTPVTDGAPNIPPHKRATSRAKSARLWKRAKAQLESESDLSEIEEVTDMDSEDPSDPQSEGMTRRRP
ncbi:Hypothetical predicted protein [Pelobates cultripes]|uniref:Uncharacterized protein n=1 Tax=Pelobates cultripes TaxID=61616 RepID=A0AAD1TDW0_PELCU|nr:Hypothetical predicted protein [Pelobates cultripes]